MQTVDDFREALLLVMEQKHHWAWRAFEEGVVPKHLLHVHLEQEYGVYVRDFPVLVARAYVRCPLPAARRELIANVYEEETGGLVAGRPHPELFLEYPTGLGMDLRRFENITLLPGAKAYRTLIDQFTLHGSWVVAAAVTTLFLEGTRYERGELERDEPRRPKPPLEAHPLVRHYGLDIERLALTRAHRTVEGDHRKSAWNVVLECTEPAERTQVLEAMKRMLSSWHAYRNEVAVACGLEQGPDGAPRLARPVAASEEP